jgi:hypothetical protein
MDCPDKPQKEVKAMTNERRLSRRMFLGGSIGVAGLASNMVAFSTHELCNEVNRAVEGINKEGRNVFP